MTPAEIPTVARLSDPELRFVAQVLLSARQACAELGWHDGADWLFDRTSDLLDERDRRTLMFSELERDVWPVIRPTGPERPGDDKPPSEDVA